MTREARVSETEGGQVTHDPGDVMGPLIDPTAVDTPPGEAMRSPEVAALDELLNKLGGAQRDYDDARLTEYRQGAVDRIYTLREEIHTLFGDEKARRVRYQDIVYAVLLRLEQAAGAQDTLAYRPAVLALLDRVLSERRPQPTQAAIDAFFESLRAAGWIFTVAHDGIDARADHLAALRAAFAAQP